MSYTYAKAVAYSYSGNTAIPTAAPTDRQFGQGFAHLSVRLVSEAGCTIQPVAWVETAAGGAWRVLSDAFAVTQGQTFVIDHPVVSAPAAVEFIVTEAGESAVNLEVMGY